MNIFFEFINYIVIKVILNKYFFEPVGKYFFLQSCHLIFNLFPIFKYLSEKNCYQCFLYNLKKNEQIKNKETFFN